MTIKPVQRMKNRVGELLFDIKKLAASKLVVVEKLEDEEIIQMREAACRTCPNNINGECKVCGCILELKVKSKVNRNKKLGTEITHCPEGKWGDQQIAKYYQEK